MKVFNGFKVFLFILSLVLYLIFSTSVYAGITGKIAGKVIDDATGEPLFGATILIEGTSMGNKAGPDGSYYIINISPGNCSVIASMIGYTSVKVEKVQVIVDQTTEVSFRLKTQAVTLKKSITVIAERPIIDKGVTANLRTISSEQIARMPVSEVTDVLKSQAGFVTRNMELHVRGGRAGEVLYIVDGVATKDILGGLGLVSAGMNISTSDIQEIDVLKGGFDAEFGGSQSAAVNIITKEGSSKKTEGRIEFLTDDLGSSSLNKYSFNSDKLEFSLSGPELLFSKYILPSFITQDFLPFFGINLNGENLTYRISGSVYKTNTFMDVNQWATPQTRKLFRVDNFLGFEIPERMNNQYSAQIKTSYKISPSKRLIFSYTRNWERYTVYFNPTSATRGDWNIWRYRYTPATLPQIESNTSNFSLRFTHNVSRSTFYEISLYRFNYEKRLAPGDPNNPGGYLTPGDFLDQTLWESFTDLNHNGIWDTAEPFQDVNGNKVYDKGEPFEDRNGNGKWDKEEDFVDTRDSDNPADTGNGKYDPEKSAISLGGYSLDTWGTKGVDRGEPYWDGDSLIGEPFTDIDGDGVYDSTRGDLWIPYRDDLNGNSVYDGPYSDACPGLQHCETRIPYIDRNHNGMYDKPNYRWDPGEAYTDVNGNGKYDGQDFFYDKGYEARCYYQDRSENRLGLRFKLTSQVTKEHLLSWGFSIQNSKVSLIDIRYPYTNYNGPPDNGAWPTKGVFREFWTHKPTYGDIWISDNLEYGAMIAKLGVRLDFFSQSNDLLWMPLEERIRISSDQSTPVSISKLRAKISPRLGVSYPILEKAKVFFYYGHFYQLPELQWMFGRPTQGSTARRLYGNPNLGWSKMIAYEFGVQYAISDVYALNVSGFYKDYFELFNSVNIQVGPDTWDYWTNIDYARARGVETELEKRYGGYITGKLNYQYSFAFGKSSEEASNYYNPGGIFYQEYPLDWDVRHQLTLNLDLRISKADHPRIFGLKMPDNWGVNVIWQYRTGFPFTPASTYPGISPTLRRNENPVPYSKRMPSSSNIDLRFNKDFDIWKLSYSFTLWINNVFDRKDVADVYSNTGRANTSRSYYSDYYQDNITLPGFEIDNSPYNYQSGRNIRVGLAISF